jgi:hypothetical protein
MKRAAPLLLACLVWAAAAASAQTVRQTVITDASGTLIAPVNLWEANAAAIVPEVVSALESDVALSATLPAGYLASTDDGTSALSFDGTDWTIAEPQAFIEGLLDDEGLFVLGDVKYGDRGLYYASSLLVNIEESALQSWDGEPTLYWTMGGSFLNGSWTAAAMEDDQVPFSVLGLAGQTADLQRWGIVGDTEMVKIEADGTLVLDGSPVPAPKYPVFVLNVPPGTDWTDFELKASRTNFGATGTPDLVFYSHSPGATGTEVGATPDVYFTDSGFSDPREWRELVKSPRTSIAASLSDVNAKVGSIVVVVTASGVLSKANEDDLVWSYVWMDESSREQDGAGRPIWRATVPVQWISAPYDLD